MIQLSPIAGSAHVMLAIPLNGNGLESSAFESPFAEPTVSGPGAAFREVMIEADPFDLYPFYYGAEPDLETEKEPETPGAGQNQIILLALCVLVGLWFWLK